MKNRLLPVIVLSLLAFGPGFRVQAADLASSRLTVELKDGSRVVGDSVAKNFAFKSALLGKIKLDVKDIRWVECISSNSFKLTVGNGDSLLVSFVDSTFAVKTSFGTVELQVNSMRKLSVSAGGLYTHLPGLVAAWPADGNADTMDDAHNGILSASGVTFAPGKVGMGFRLDGINGSIQIPDSPALKPAKVTVEAWVWLDPSTPPNHGGEAIIFKKNTWSAFFEGYNLCKDRVDNGNGTSTDRFAFVISNHGNQVILHSITVAERGVWYHVAGTYDGNKSTLWVNGVAENSATPGFALDYDTTPVYIGTSGTWAPYLSMFSGIINQPAIFNRALSADEIREEYMAGGSN
jgi:hypothetical protein